MQTNTELGEMFNWQQQQQEKIPQQNKEQTEKLWVRKDNMKQIQEYTDTK